MKKTTARNLFSTILVFVLFAAMVLSFSACSPAPAEEDPPVPTAESTPDVAETELGEGATQFFFEVVTVDGKTEKFTINTDETSVGDALVALDLIEGEDGEFGLFVNSVNGVVADFDTDGTYWAFYVDGEYASSGVDSTDITADSTYAFKVEK